MLKTGCGWFRRESGRPDWCGWFENLGAAGSCEYPASADRVRPSRRGETGCGRAGIWVRLVRLNAAGSCENPASAAACAGWVRPSRRGGNPARAGSVRPARASRSLVKHTHPPYSSPDRLLSESPSPPEVAAARCRRPPSARVLAAALCSAFRPASPAGLRRPAMRRRSRASADSSEALLEGGRSCPASHTKTPARPCARDMRAFSRAVARPAPRRRVTGSWPAWSGITLARRVCATVRCEQSRTAPTIKINHITLGSGDSMSKMDTFMCGCTVS
jgi:hypothetical protein